MERVDDPQENLNDHLLSVHAIEAQALLRMAASPGIVGDAALTREFQVHFDETVTHERRVRERLRDRGREPAPLSGDAAPPKGPVVVFFAESRPDSPVDLLAHAYAYEHLESTLYDMLRAAAVRAGDPETVMLAEEIEAEEARMARGLEAHFQAAVVALIRRDRSDASLGLDLCLADLHAIESQEVELLEARPALVADSRLGVLYRDHLEETHRQRRRLEQRLAARGAEPSELKEAAHRLRALHAGELFAAQPDADPVLAGFSLAFEHLEIAGYTMLAELAELAGDPDTVAAARASLAEESALAERLDGEFERILVHG